MFESIKLVSVDYELIQLVFGGDGVTEVAGVINQPMNWQSNNSIDHKGLVTYWQNSCAFPSI